MFDVAVALYDMTNYTLDIPTASYPLQDDETWTSINVPLDKNGTLKMSMIGGNDGSVERCGIKRTMLVTVSNFNKP